jgi:hypothetical protein
LSREAAIRYSGRSNHRKECRIVRLRQFLTVCLLLLPCGAWADDVTPEQAQALQQQLQEWLSGLLGPSVKMPKLPWQITGEGDHYLISWPIRGLDQPTGDTAATATVRPLDANRWSIDRVGLPPAAAFTVTLPSTGDKPISGPMKFSYSIDRQDTHGTIDVTQATPSTLHSELDGLVLTSDMGTQHQEQHFGRYAIDIGLAPTQDGRLDLSMNGGLDDWKSASQVNGGSAIAVAVQKLRAVGKVDGIRRERVGELLTAIGDFIGALPNDAMENHDTKHLSAAAREQLRLIVLALGDMMSGLSLEETVDGLKVEMTGLGAIEMKHFKIGFGGDAPDGKLHLWLDVGAAGLQSPSLPPKIAALLPHHIEIKPSLSGIMTSDLQKLALDATEADAKDNRLVPDLGAILLHGEATLGLETLSFDLGPAEVEGTGHVTMSSPNTWRGEAHLTATGLDDLVTQARTDPALQQALPVLIMARGLAKQDGDRLVWDVVSEGPKVTVNGMDLSALGGTDKSKGKPR